MRKRANICAARFREINGAWKIMYNQVLDSLEHLGYEVAISDQLKIGSGKYKKSIIRGLQDESRQKDLFVYNHTYRQDLIDKEIYRSENSLFLKPTGPTPAHYTIDRLGYGSYLSIAYEKPNFENYDYRDFFDKKVKKWIENDENKWSDRPKLRSISSTHNIPDNHILVLGQMTADETVTNFSFGNHWKKLLRIVQEVQKRKDPIVIKLHPEYYNSLRKSNRASSRGLDDQIIKWMGAGITVITDLTSLHDVLPKTKVAITENSTSGIECMLHSVPIISYGYPEYHWITKDLRHVCALNPSINDMSWFDVEKARSFIAWYCEEYMCYDYDSTVRRLKQLL